MENTVYRFSLILRLVSLFALAMAIVNAIVIFGVRAVPLADLSPFAALWMSILQVLNAALALGVAFMGAEAGLAGGPADAAARRRIGELTAWLPAAAALVIVVNLVSPVLGQVVGDRLVAQIAWTPRQMVGQLLLLGWALFGWAAVQRWLRQGPALALGGMTRIMEALALVALALDMSQLFDRNVGSPVQIGAVLGEGLNAITQTLAVVVCVEAVSDPDPARLEGWLGTSVRLLAVLAWAVLALQLGVEILAVAGQFDLSVMVTLSPLTVAAGALVAFAERQLLSATLWAREQRLLGARG